MTTDAMKPIDGQSPKSARRWLRFSLRSMLLLVALAGIPLGWVGWKVDRARNQRLVVAELQKLNAEIIYDYQIVRNKGEIAFSRLPPPGPKWLSDLLGKEWLVEVFKVTAEGPHVTDETIELVARLPGVEAVAFLSGTGITDSGLAHLAGMHDLVGVWLSSDRITGTGIQHLTGLKKLTHLMVEGWATDEALEQISKLTNLEVLHLFETDKITDSGLANIAKLHNLQSLRFGSGEPTASGCQDCMRITDEGLVSLHGLKNLKFLGLYYDDRTQMTQEGRDQLQKALPDCRIKWNLGPNDSE